MNTRLRKLKNVLNKKRLDALLVSSTPNITYLTGYSGFSPIEREVYLLIAPNKQYIITDGRYSEAVALHIPHFELIERTVKKPFKEIFKNLAKKYKIKKLGVEEDNITISEQKLLRSCFNDLNHFSINVLRTIKDKSEIDAIEKACNLSDKAFTYVLNKIKEGVTEKEVAFEIEYFIKKNGGELSFPSIVAFGNNTSVPHHQTSTNSKLITHNSFILLDFGVKLNNYCSDMTRTIFFGIPTAEQKKVYQTVFTAQQKAIKHLDSIMARDVDKAARDYIVSKTYPTIPHSFGHGVGLEVHELPHLSPNSKDKLKPGMVFSIEPGIYIPGFGGVRIEDLVVLEKNGPRLLTKSQKEIITL